MLKERSKTRKTALVIVGDFNFPRVKWIDGSGLFSSEDMALSENIFIEKLDDCPLTQCITGPTFCKIAATELENHIEGNTLDLLLTCSPDRVFSIQHDAPLGDLKCAHNVLRWMFTVSTESHTIESRCSTTAVRISFNWRVNSVSVIGLACSGSMM